MIRIEKRISHYFSDGLTKFTCNITRVIKHSEYEDTQNTKNIVLDYVYDQKWQISVLDREVYCSQSK